MKTKLYASIIVLSVLITTTSFADESLYVGTIDSVAVSGVSVEHIQNAFNLLLSVEEGPLNYGLVSSDIETLRNYLSGEGWWHAEVEAVLDTAGGKNFLEFRLIPGEPVLWGDIIIESEIPLKLETEHLKGKPLTKMSLNSLVEEILVWYAGLGYHNAAISLSFIATEDLMDMRVLVDSGTIAVVDSIIVRGLVNTKESVIIHELRHILGKPATSATLAMAGTRVARLGFVTLQGEPRFETHSQDKCAIVVELSEGSQGAFEGILGFQPGQDSKAGLLGTVNLDLNNLFGTGGSSRLRWRKLGENTENLDFSLAVPHFFGTLFSARVGFMHDEFPLRDFTRTVILTGGALPVGDFHEFETFLRYEKTSSDSLASYTATGIEFSYSWSNMTSNSVFTPGTTLRTGISGVVRKNGYSEDSYLSRTSIDLDRNFPLSVSRAVGMRVRYRRVDTRFKNISPADRFWLGGASTIRGYRESMFPAVEALWGSLEYSLKSGDNSRVFLFLDSGHLVNSVKNGNLLTRTSANPVGYGFGMRIASKAGTFSFDYGKGKEDSLGEGKIHFGLSHIF